MRLAAYTAAGIAAALGAAALLLHRTPAEAPPLSESLAVRAVGDIETTPESRKVPTASAASTVPTPVASPPPDYRTQLRTTEDILQLVERLHRLATEGDAAAQYWLYRALDVCGEHYSTIFVHLESGPIRELTPDEVLQRPVQLSPMPPDELRALHRKCQRMRATDSARFGDLGKWLMDSAKGAYPLAQAEAAFIKAAEADFSPDPLERAKELAEARQLSIDALSSGDPETLMVTRSIATRWDPNDAEAGSRAFFAWTIAACLRGADCSPQAYWVKNWCFLEPQCQPYESGLDIIRRRKPEQFDEYVARAREINSHIDARRWEALGF